MKTSAKYFVLADGP